jgi:hypothetical protein
VLAVEEDASMDSCIKVFAFYDSKILPPGSKHATNARTTRPTTGNSAIEMIFEFFAGLQQVTQDATFDEIAKANVCMSITELTKFTQMMFVSEPFTRQEVSWVFSKAKLEPITPENWHGDQARPQTPSLVTVLVVVFRSSPSPHLVRH